MGVFLLLFALCLVPLPVFANDVELKHPNLPGRYSKTFNGSKNKPDLYSTKSLPRYSTSKSPANSGIIRGGTQSEKVFYGRFSMGQGHDDNANYSPGSGAIQVFGVSTQLSESSQPKSDNFFAGQALLGYNKKLGRFAIFGNVSSNVNLYKKIDASNTHFFSASQGISYLMTEKLIFSTNLAYGSFARDSLSTQMMNSKSVTPGLTYMFTKNFSYTIFASLGLKTYNQNSMPSVSLTDRNSSYYTVGNSANLSGYNGFGSWFISAYLTYTKERAKKEWWSNNTYTPGIQLSHRFFQDKIAIRGSSMYMYSKFLEPSNEVGTQDKRTSKFLVLGGELSYNFTPETSVAASYTKYKADSNIPLYAFDRNVGLVKFNFGF